MASVLDADTHIAEPAAMWDYLDPEWRARRPVVVSVPEDTQYGKADHMWLIDGSIYPRTAGKGGMLLVTPISDERRKIMPDGASRELADIGARLEDMARLDTDRQVVYPTLFLTWLTDDPAFEVGLCKAYNRYVAQACAASGGKISWVVVPPLRDVEATVSELRWGKEHGAVGVFFRGIEGDRTLDDPYFFPVYEEAQALNLTITVHQGSGSPALNALVDIQRSHTFTHGRLPPLVAFRNLVANRIPELFTGLRWGFIETGASWVPFALHQLRGVFTKDAPERWGPRLFEDYRMWISYEVEEDLPYLAKIIGEDHLVTGTDYGHHGIGGAPGDPSAQLNMVGTLRGRDDGYSSSALDKLLIDNPRALYGI